MTATLTPAIETRRPEPSAWARSLQNLPREHGFEPLRIEGSLPPELDGTYYRNGAGRFDVFGERYGHWFDADGAVTGVRLEAGRASGAVYELPDAGRARTVDVRSLDRYVGSLIRGVVEGFSSEERSSARPDRARPFRSHHPARFSRAMAPARLRSRGPFIKRTA